MSVVQLTLPMFIGTILNWLLFGTLLVQIYLYFMAFPKDAIWWKRIVILILVLELVETFSNIRDMAHAFGDGWGDPDALDNVGWAWFSVPVMGAVISFVCQAFYSWRIHVISKSWWFAALVMLVTTVQLAAGIWTGAQICKAGKFSLLQTHNLTPTALWLSTTTFADLLIVGGTIYYLRRSTDPDFTSAKTNSLVSRLIMLVAQTGVLCMMFALVDLFLFVKYKGTNYHLSLCIELSKIYSNCILVIFNSRAHIGHQCNPTDSYTSVDISNSLFRTRAPSTGPIEIGVSVSSDARSDITDDKRRRRDTNPSMV
ncbi:hypothetical protein R3P38DRAFT_3263390 [Favolaschia claudopus]|uniref:DUF6534 domain-containing protein n=1 Tax=Favolaschia claudopus TaxID=2862362 RepID=A0AAW0CA36_9AGAR